MLVKDQSIWFYFSLHSLASCCSWRSAALRPLMSIERSADASCCSYQQRTSWSRLSLTFSRRTEAAERRLAEYARYSSLQNHCDGVGTQNNVPRRGRASYSWTRRTRRPPWSFRMQITLWRCRTLIQLTQRDWDVCNIRLQVVDLGRRSSRRSLLWAPSTSPKQSELINATYLDLCNTLFQLLQSFWIVTISCDLLLNTFYQEWRTWLNDDVETIGFCQSKPC